MDAIENLGIHFGAMSPPLKKQLAPYKLSPPIISRWQSTADAITLLHLHGFLTEAEKMKSRGRLFKQIRFFIVKNSPVIKKI